MALRKSDPAEAATHTAAQQLKQVGNGIAARSQPRRPRAQPLGPRAGIRWT